MAQTLKFQRKFKPLTVEIEGKDEAVHFFETVSLTKSVEREMVETMENAQKAFSGSGEETTIEEAMKVAIDMVLGTIDKMIVPAKGKKTKASKVLRELWEDDEIESMDLLDFLNELGTKRRPT